MALTRWQINGETYNITPQNIRVITATTLLQSHITATDDAIITVMKYAPRRDLFAYKRDRYEAGQKLDEIL